MPAVTCSVQHVQKTAFLVNDHLLPVGVLDGRIVLVNKMVVAHLDGESGLPNASLSKDHQLVAATVIRGH